MIVEAGNLVVLRDGRKVLVTDAAEQGEGGMVMAGYDDERVTMPAETIFTGVNIHTDKFVTSDMSEVVEVIHS